MDQSLWLLCATPSARCKKSRRSLSESILRRLQGPEPPRAVAEPTKSELSRGAGSPNKAIAGSAGRSTLALAVVPASVLVLNLSLVPFPTTRHSHQRAVPPASKCYVVSVSVVAQT